MRINHNIAALNTYRQLNGATNAQSKSMEKLSSGLRINRAGDDAAGLAISEKMRAQIKGLDQASANAQDGISMLQTAEGALNETHSILQRMRELATQAANDSNVEVDRNEIQKEMNQLTSEINRIGNTTEFNTQKVLQGQGTDPTVKNEMDLKNSGLVTTPTALAGGNITPATAASVQIQIAGAADNSSGTEVIIGKSLTASFNGQDITVNYLEDNENFDPNEMTFNDTGSEVTVYVKNGTSKESIARLTQDALKGAIDKNTYIDAEDYTFELNGDSINITTTGTGSGETISVDNVENNFNAADLLAASPTMSTTDGTVTSTGVNEARAYATVDVQFTLGGIKNEVLKSGVALTNTDYFNGSSALTIDGLKSYLTDSGLTIGEEAIEFYDGAEGEYKGSAEFAVDLNDIAWVTTTGTDAAVDGDLDKLVTGIVSQIGDKMENVELTETVTADDQTITVTAKQAGTEGNSITITDGVDRPTTDIIGSTFEASFQIGANTGQSMTIEITDMRAQALKVSGAEAGGEVKAKNGEVASYVAVENVTNGTNNDNVEFALDVSSHENATAAISVINDAIESVSAERSKLGAYQNRLEHTINNLGTSSENLTAAESRIRDVDMAKEIMDSTKAGILSQAAQAMMAQANQQPQGVLQLLR